MNRPQFVLPRRTPGLAMVLATLAAGLFQLSTGAMPAVAQPSPPEDAATATERAPEPGSISRDAAAEPNEAGGSSPSTAGERGGEAAGSDAGDKNASDASRATSPASTTPAAEPSTVPAGNDQATGDTPSAVGDAAKPPESDRTTAADPTKPDREVQAKPEAKPAEAPLKIAVWPGAFGEAQRSVTIDRFRARHGDAKIEVATRGASRIDDLRPALEGIDAGEFSAAEIEAGCRDGLLRKIADADGFAAITGEARDDFLPGSLRSCGIGAFAWSHILAYKASAFEKRSPDSLSDVFDTKRFPGKRAFIKEAKYLFEVALLADGVAPAEIYTTLATEEGRLRALAKLATIRDDIIWVGSSRDALDELDSGRAVMAQTFSGQAFFATARGADLGLIWDGQVYALSYWAIPAASTQASAAGGFIRFATEPQQLAAVAERFPYGPTRGSALPLATRHAATGLALERFLPTAESNMKSAVAFDETWWIENRAAVDVVFSSWLAQPAGAAAQP